MFRVVAKSIIAFLIHAIVLAIDVTPEPDVFVYVHGDTRLICRRVLVPGGYIDNCHIEWRVK